MSLLAEPPAGLVRSASGVTARLSAWGLCGIVHSINHMLADVKGLKCPHGGNLAKALKLDEVTSEIDAGGAANEDPVMNLVDKVGEMTAVDPSEWTGSMFEELESFLPAVKDLIAALPDEQRQRVAHLLSDISTLEDATNSTSLIESETETKLLSKRASSSSGAAALDSTVGRKSPPSSCTGNNGHSRCRRGERCVCTGNNGRRECRCRRVGKGGD